MNSHKSAAHSVSRRCTARLVASRDIGRPSFKSIETLMAGRERMGRPTLFERVSESEVGSLYATYGCRGMVQELLDNNILKGVLCEGVRGSGSR